MADGYRESEPSWSAVLLDMTSWGRTTPPKWAIGDGAWGFWAALEKLYPETRQQRCWGHKAANVISKCPKRLPSQAKDQLREIVTAETQADAQRALDLFLETYRDNYPAAAACLEKDRQKLLTFYDFPAAHWRPIRTTHPIEGATAGSSGRFCVAAPLIVNKRDASKWRWNIHL